MSRTAHTFSVAALIAIAVCVPATSAAQTRMPSHVRVVPPSEQVLRWLEPQTDVILVVDQGTTLEVIDFDREKASYWVVLPPDVHGTRRVGWIRASSVEPYVPMATPQVELPAFSSEAQRNEAPAPALAPPATTAPAAAEDKVSITLQPDTATSADRAAGARKSYTFEDVHFERDRFSIRSEDMERLRAVASALERDPSLVLSIEGHTCNLGSGAHNLALGERRANAVKDYLVSAGASADRLLTVSKGEAGAEYDNSREDTRRLNRRVALVPTIPR